MDLYVLECSLMYDEENYSFLYKIDLYNIDN